MFSMSKKIVSSTVLFASAPALALQAQGKVIDNSLINSVSQRQNFLQNI